MVRLSSYSVRGVKKTAVSLPKRFQEEINFPLLAQAIRVYEAGKHPGLSKTKTRGEVKASTRKIWRQKGTGRARHGARSAPIFVGGGVAHGPKGVKRKLKLPRKMREKALKVALTLKAKDGKMVIVDGISKLKKTKEAAALLEKIAQSEKGIAESSRFTFVLADSNFGARLALRNLGNVEIVRFSDLNAHQVYLGGALVLDKDALGRKGSESTSRKKGSKTIGKNRKPSDSK